MNTFTRVMAETAVNNQQDINNMLHQMNELSQRMNKTAAHIESITASVDNGQTGRNVARMVEHMGTKVPRLENIVQVLEGVAQDPATK